MYPEEVNQLALYTRSLFPDPVHGGSAVRAISSLECGDQHVPVCIHRHHWGGLHFLLHAGRGSFMFVRLLQSHVSIITDLPYCMLPSIWCNEYDYVIYGLLSNASRENKSTNVDFRP